jgi:DDE superfamily endonuclease
MITAPAMELTPQAIDNLVEELREYHAISRPLLRRRAQREGAAKSLHGLLLDSPRKSIEPMVLALEGAKAQAVRTLQWFSSEGAWDDAVLRQRHWQKVDTSLGEDDGVLTLDGSDVLQQGRESVGVKRQYCGAVGKRAHCPAGVFVGYSSRPGLHSVRPPSLLAAGVGGGRRVCRATATLGRAHGPALENQADIGLGDEPSDTPRPDLAGTLGDL